MKRRYDDGGEVDALEAMNYSDEARDIAESVGTGARNMDVPKAKPTAAPKAKPKPAAKLIDPSNIRSGRRSDEESQKTSADETKMSLAERAKMSRERARAGSGPTDTRSVSQRIRSAFGMKSGGATKMASGGMTSSASKRADGIATKGKTRGKMC
jgi:hypothetical protein